MNLRGISPQLKVTGPSLGVDEDIKLPLNEPTIMNTGNENYSYFL
jgi:hypothetical protein